ncbi:hypothetical protein AB0K09_00560 [Streptomyces sp. NPDC049577]|uniref:hypothetical protein n=1 Tax=Streptomyces sp. NPDC049577 TaxID=3155153 RepID=UPI003441F21D
MNARLRVDDLTDDRLDALVAERDQLRAVLDIVVEELAHWDGGTSLARLRWKIAALDAPADAARELLVRRLVDEYGLDEPTARDAVDRYRCGEDGPHHHLVDAAAHAILTELGGASATPQNDARDAHSLDLQRSTGRRPDALAPPEGITRITTGPDLNRRA